MSMNGAAGGPYPAGSSKQQRSILDWFATRPWQPRYYAGSVRPAEYDATRNNHRASLSRALRHLSRRGILRREQGAPGDRPGPGYWLVLTEDGQAVVDAVRQWLAEQPRQPRQECEAGERRSAASRDLAAARRAVARLGRADLMLLRDDIARVLRKG